MIPRDDLNFILVRFEIGFKRSGTLSGMFLTTPEKLEAIKKLPPQLYPEALGKFSEPQVDFALDGLFTVLTEDQAFIREAARIFGVWASGHVNGFDLFGNIIDEGAWDGTDYISAPWLELNADNPVEATHD